MIYLVPELSPNLKDVRLQSQARVCARNFSWSCHCLWTTLTTTDKFHVYCFRMQLRCSSSQHPSHQDALHPMKILSAALPITYAAHARLSSEIPNVERSDAQCARRPTKSKLHRQKSSGLQIFLQALQFFRANENDQGIIALSIRGCFLQA